MNLLGEVLRFGDRKFYSDWWNAQTIGGFWKAWNIPVHRWATRYSSSRFRKYIKGGNSLVTLQNILVVAIKEKLLCLEWKYVKLAVPVNSAAITGIWCFPRFS